MGKGRSEKSACELRSDALDPGRALTGEGAAHLQIRHAGRRGCQPQTGPRRRRNRIRAGFRAASRRTGGGQKNPAAGIPAAGLSVL